MNINNTEILHKNLKVLNMSADWILRSYKQTNTIILKKNILQKNFISWKIWLPDMQEQQICL